MTDPDGDAGVTVRTTEPVSRLIPRPERRSRDRRGRFTPRQAWTRADGETRILRYWLEDEDEPPSVGEEISRLWRRLCGRA